MQTCPNCGEANQDTARFCQACGTPLAPATEEVKLPAESRKMVTLVFCDLTGSTALGEKMDPESLRRVVTRYFNDMKAVLTRHGGTVEKFIGDAVMAAFGIPTLHEDDALRGVRAAVEMQQAMEEMNLDLELEYGVGIKARIGVNTGEVIAGDASQGHGFVSGDAVNVAARLEQTAPPGEVLIGEATYRLVRDAVKVEPVEPLELKGKSERVPAYRILEVIPHALGTSRRLDSAIVGRDQELAQLLEVFDSAVAEGACRLVTIFGMAGSGKSRLTAEFLTSLGGRVTVLTGRCLPYGEGITYWPVSEAVKSFCDIKELDSADKAKGKVSAVLPEAEESALIVDRIAAAIGLSDATPDTQETFWAVRRFFEELGREKPVVFLCDDIHWAEPTMLDLIEYLAGFSRGVPMLLLSPSRQDLLDTRPSWGADSTTISLEPLDESHIGRLIENLLVDAHLPDTVRRQITAAAEGNPLYVEEILRMLIDDGILEEHEGRWKAVGEIGDLTIPPSIQALIAARLDRLGVNEQAVTQRAAVIGKTFYWGAVSELSPEALRMRVGHYLQSLIRKELVLPDESNFAGEDAFRFGHIMIRDAAYQAMPKELRAELHERFAEWLTAKTGDRVKEFEEILGYHYEHAYRLRQELGPLDEKGEELGRRALELLTASGNKAFARTDMPAAVNLLGRAAKLLPIRDPRRLQLSLTLSDALMEIGELQEAGEVIEQILKVSKVLKDQAMEARASLQRCLLRSYTDVENWKDEARSETERLIPLFEELGDDFGLARSQFLLAQVHWDDYKMAAAEQALEQALAHARDGGNSHDEAKILSSLSATLFWGPAPADKAIALCEEIIEKSGGNRFVQATCILRTAGLQAMRAEFDEARSLVARARGIFNDLGQAFPLARSTHEAGFIELLADDPARAETEFREGIAALESMGEKAFLATSAVLLSQALYAQGRFDEAMEANEMGEDASGDDPAMKAEWGPWRARILAQRSEMDAAVALAREALEIAAEPDDVFVRGGALQGLGEVLLLAGKKDEATGPLREALQMYEAKGVAPMVARVTAALAMADAGV
ncbi:MAG TPA: adenylate/guanylate cyclase domain-containing protein [Actinomycetota bacterium]|jgi:predicted ATPase/class 3 adenylate cyclase